MRDNYLKFWGQPVDLEDWVDGSKLPMDEGSYDVVFTTNGKKGKAWFDGVKFFTPGGEAGLVFAWKRSKTKPSHELGDNILPLAVEDFTQYQSTTGEERALQMLAENALESNGLNIEITMSRVSSTANGAMTIQRVLAMSENQTAVFDGTPEIKALQNFALDRPLEFNRNYTIDFKNGQGIVADGIRYTVSVTSLQTPGTDRAAPGMLQAEEKAFIERQILMRLQFFTPIELYQGLGGQTPVGRAVEDALVASQHHFHASAPRKTATILVSDDLAAVALETMRDDEGEEFAERQDG